ncbi:MAG: hypothetical protein V5783_00680 [Pontiella sp.]
MTRNIITTAIAVSLVAGVCVAEETEVKESKDFSIRVSLGNAPGIDEVESSGGSGSINDDGGARVEIIAVKRWWGKSNSNIGGSFGGGVFFGNHALSDGGIEVDLTTFGVLLQGGFIAKAGDHIVLEVGPYLGIGIADNETSGYSGSGTGSYGLFGVKGGAFFLLGSKVELGLELGYEAFSHEQEYDGGWIGNEDVTFSGSGVHVAAVFAVKF